MSSLCTKDVDIEGAVYVGTVVSAIMYGIYLGVYYLLICALLANTNATRLHQNFYISFSSVLLLLNTIFFMPLPYTGLMMWEVMRNRFPGGTFAYYRLESESTLINLLSNIAQSLALTLNDGLLIYRCYIIFGSRFYVVVLPALCSFAFLALNLVTIALITNHKWPESDLVLEQYKLYAAGNALSTATNVMVTAMISIRIFFCFSDA